MLHNFLEHYPNDFLPGFNLPILGAIFFAVLIFILVIYILIYQRLIRDTEAKYKRWDIIADNIIRDAIFFDSVSAEDMNSDHISFQESIRLNISDRLIRILKNKKFRIRLMKKILYARHDVSGDAAENLTNLFRLLELDRDIDRMLQSKSWYLNAMAIQTVGVVNLKEFRDHVYRFTDNKRGLIRVESQNAMVRFDGFEGLRFLDTATYPITEWQQIKLFDQLSNLSHEHFTGIEIWLKSENDTVVIFSLKLVRTYHRFELYDQVLECLKHKNEEVRKEAILVLKVLPNPKTAPILTALYSKETEKNQILILDVMSCVSSEEDMPFLMNLLSDENNDVKMNAAKAIASLGSRGMDLLESHPNNEIEPLCQIIAQIKEESV